MKTFDVNVESFIPLISPNDLKNRLPVEQASAQAVISGRKAIEAVIEQRDQRLLVITGPCSIHDEEAALVYARRLSALQQEVAQSLLLVMRVYFEKPRTTIGWKGFINDPYMDGSYDMGTGLEKARSLLRRITAMGLPTATEFLDPVTPQYLAGLVCWTAVGARTTESQTHREMASGLSMPVGFKNGTEGGLSTALNAMIAARSPQSFLGIDPNGMTSIVRTKGNPHAHLVLRGGRRPNYDSVSIRDTIDALAKHNLPQSIIVDCSHANSRKQYQEQALVWEDVLNQRLSGNQSIIGMMLESNINEGRQKNTGDPATMKFGVSITDACIGWDTTEELIRSAHQALSSINTM